MRLLRHLTAGRFRDGAVARVLAMEFWTRGEAPTQRADGDWKALRKAKAKSALETLAKIAPVRGTAGRL